MDVLRPEFDVVCRLPDPSNYSLLLQGQRCFSRVSLQEKISSFKQYLGNICFAEMKKKSPCSKEFLLKSSWPKPNFLPGLKYFLAQHLVQIQICTLSKIFLGQKVDPESRHVPVRPQTEVPPPRELKRYTQNVGKKLKAQIKQQSYLIDHNSIFLKTNLNFFIQYGAYRNVYFLQSSV